jgi:hypothetical protein
MDPGTLSFLYDIIVPYGVEDAKLKSIQRDGRLSVSLTALWPSFGSPVIREQSGQSTSSGRRQLIKVAGLLSPAESAERLCGPLDSGRAFIYLTSK